MLITQAKLSLQNCCMWFTGNQKNDGLVFLACVYISIESYSTYRPVDLPWNGIILIKQRAIDKVEKLPLFKQRNPSHNVGKEEEEKRKELVLRKIMIKDLLCPAGWFSHTRSMQKWWVSLTPMLSPETLGILHKIHLIIMMLLIHKWQSKGSLSVLDSLSGKKKKSTSIPWCQTSTTIKKPIHDHLMVQTGLSEIGLQ